MDLFLVGGLQHPWNKPVDRRTLYGISKPEYLLQARPKRGCHQHKSVHEIRIVHGQPAGDRRSIRDPNDDDRMIRLVQTIQYRPDSACLSMEVGHGIGQPAITITRPVYRVHRRSRQQRAVGEIAFPITEGAGCAMDKEDRSILSGAHRKITYLSSFGFIIIYLWVDTTLMKPGEQFLVIHPKLHQSVKHQEKDDDKNKQPHNCPE